MFNRLVFISLIFGFSCLGVSAQVERLLVETYYISDSADATDTFGGQLEEGSTTYRIYVDLLPESRLLAIYGDVNHPLVFTSTAPFFNHREEGITFGKDLSRNRFETGTVPLDSYITLGQCSRSFTQGAYFGVPKELDLDGSVIGGDNNDGGSSEIPTGLLTNDDTRMGLPLVTADGLGLKTSLPNSWVDIGFIDVLTSSDTTIFGADTPKYIFNRNDVVLRNSGVKGIDTVQNEILIAQLTTIGEITFEINLEVEIANNGSPQIVKYVARNESLLANEVFVPLLSYPYTCGCKDPDYLEADPDFACEDNSLCKTPIVFGCMDSLACNYNPDANFSLDQLCCFVGFCSDLDISIVCPDLQPRAGHGQTKLNIHPNPASTEIHLVIDQVEYNEVKYTIYDMFGRLVTQGVLHHQDRYIDISGLPGGMYTIHTTIEKNNLISTFIKM